MREDGSDTDLPVSREQHGAQKWRGRLMSTASKLKKVSSKRDNPGGNPEQREDDISDFLRGSDSALTVAPRGETSLAPTPPIGTATYEARRSRTSLGSRPTTAHSSHSPQPKARKRRNAKGLHVSFTLAEPDIIGEGGDEAELPSRHVSRARPNAFRHQEGVSGATAGALHPILRERGYQDSATSAVQVEASAPVSVPEKSTGIQRKPVASLRDGRAAMEVEDDRVLVEKRARYTALAEAHGENSQVLGPRMSFDSDLSTAPSTASFVQSSLQNSFNPGSQAPKNGSTTHSSSAQPPSRSTLVVDGKASDHLNTDRPQNPASKFSISRRPDDLGLSPVPTLLVEKKSENNYANVVLPYPQEVPSKVSRQHDQGLDPRSESVKEMGMSRVFYPSVQHLGEVFRLSADKTRPATMNGLANWLRACIWWFLTGRKEFENSISTKHRQPQSPPTSPKMTMQAIQSYLDLAKAWWIMVEVIPGYLKVQNPASRNVIDRIDDLDFNSVNHVCQMLQAEMQAFEIHMSKYNLLPPHALSTQGGDTRIWINDHILPREVLIQTAGLDPTSLLKRKFTGQQSFCQILLEDTDRHFSYGRIFLDAEIASQDEFPKKHRHACILSIIRDRNNQRVEITIASQDGQINIHVQSDQKWGPTWKDVEWITESSDILVHLANGIPLLLRFLASDFKNLWTIYHYDQRVEMEWNAQTNESIVFEDTISVFHFVPSPGSSGNFPIKPIKRCKVRLIAKYLLLPEGTDYRKMYDGHRLVVMTPPEIKTLSHINRSFGQTTPLLFSYLRGEKSEPALLVSMIEAGKTSSMVLTFSELSKRTKLHSLLNGTYVGPDEQCREEITLQGFTMVQTGNMSATESAQDKLLLVEGLKWYHLQIINEAGGAEHVKTVLSDSLRICMTSNYGMLTDRTNLGTI